jgi:hypothetical protein
MRDWVTKSDAKNRKFVQRAADDFYWSGDTSDELAIVNKVLNEQDMWPLWDLLHHLKLVRRYKGALRVACLGQSLAADPEKFFDPLAPVYLYHYMHDELLREGENYGIRGDGHFFLKLINTEER